MKNGKTRPFCEETKMPRTLNRRLPDISYNIWKELRRVHAAFMRPNYYKLIYSKLMYQFYIAQLHNI